MLFGEYHFRAVLEDEALLPTFKGSTFRGVFGRALKEVTCALKQQKCPDCLLRRQCIYVEVFEFLPELHSAGRPPPPHPFVIEPPLDVRTHLWAGDQFDFSLLLFGKANDYLPYFVYAFEQMGRIGVGRHLEGRRARFRLLAVTTPTQELVYQGDQRTLRPARPLFLSLASFAAASTCAHTLSLKILTPLRLKFQNRLQAELPFHVLVRAALRRIASLLEQFGEGEPALDYRGLVARAQEVTVADSSLRWFDLKRYSHRQGQAMLLGGLVGSVTYAGNLSEFLPLLKFVEKTHLGKATTFGLGKIEINKVS